MQYSLNIVLTWILAVKRRLRNRYDQKYSQRRDQKPKIFFKRNSSNIKTIIISVPEVIKTMNLRNLWQYNYVAVGKYQLDTSEKHHTKT